ncbi:MAG: YfcC family protein [Lachnospiraceae bacterium]|jgi:uncharacterized ion transporter superfamily protein YfcC|nr:YfcC family protein [Lachnospiraceae bacterium]MCI8958919.1 YfcC family protein [Lachnospiraceae bacterium]
MKGKDSAKPAKKEFKLPETYVLIAMMLIVMAILTYIIPAGTYDMYKDEATGRQLVDATSFHFIDRSPVTPLQLLMAFYTGLNKNYSTIFFVMLVGGYFKIVNETGAITNGLSLAIGKMKDKALFAIPLVMVSFAFLGATGVLINPVVAFIPIGLVVAQQMKMDRIAAMGIVYLGCFSGWCTSFMAASSVQLAQQIAEIPVMSGVGLRFIVTSIIVAITIVYVMRYCKKIQTDRTKSILYGTADEGFGELDQVEFNHTFGGKDILILVLVFGSLVLYVWGAVVKGWGQEYMVAFLMASAIASGFIAGMSADDISRSFMKGCREMAYGAILIGFASAIAVLLTDGNIIHTIIYAASLPLKAMPKTIAAVFMFYINLVFNFFVSSASGQAAIVMPIMTPLADVVGLTRQVAVLAYQYGDGLSNTIIPTSGVLMAALGVAGVPFSKWLKFQVPLFLMWTAVCTVVMIVAVMIGYH